MNDFLDQLSQQPVAEPPPEFDRQLHARVNRTLLVQHVLDLLLGALPWAAAHFCRAVAGWLVLTLTGQFPNERKP